MNRPKLSKYTLALLLLCCCTPLAHSYSVLTHEEVVDMAWRDHTVPLLRARFPSITDDQLKEAHAYAYGGCILQDLGYYPKAKEIFSDLMHYVRTGDFVESLIRNSTNPDEFAFALGALAHYTADETGHPYVNEVTAQEFPKLAARYGKVVTYEQSRSHHMRTEFGFDVVGVAHGVYDQEAYRDFIGFEMSKPLLNQAFHETYGLSIQQVMGDEDGAIKTARWAVHSLIPRMTKVALLTYHGDIEKAHPGFDRNKFIYRSNRTEFERKWGTGYKKPGFGSHMLAVLITILPKFGPLKALKLKLPDADEQTIYLKSVNQTVDLYNARLDALKAVVKPQEIPPATASRIEHLPMDLGPVNLDTGHPVHPGEYGLSDKAHCDLLARIVREQPANVPMALRADLLHYFEGPDAQSNKVHTKEKDWQRVEANLSLLKTMPETAPIAMAAQPLPFSRSMSPADPSFRPQ